MNQDILMLLLFQHFALRAIHKNNTKKERDKTIVLLYCEIIITVIQPHVFSILDS